MATLDQSWFRARLTSLREAACQNPQPLITPMKDITSATIRGYEEEAKMWQEFKSSLDIEAGPDLPTLQLYFEWFALSRKGRIDEKPNVNTICWMVGRLANMLARNYQITIPQNTRNILVSYIQNELATRLHLSSQRYERNLATADDVSEMLKFLWTQDKHCYRNERQRIQLAFFISLLQETASRPGAIVRSDCYRKGNDALAYKDVDVWVIRREYGIQYRMDITFHDMKGTRLNPDEFLTLSIFHDPATKELGSSAILLFLTLAWLDDAFKNITSLDHLFHLEIPESRDGMKLMYKESMLSRPILRRMEKRGSYDLSPTKAWSSGSTLNQVQRVTFAGGWPQRMTPYNIRRGTLNKLNTDPTVSDAQRNQVAGHTSNKIFETNYRAKHSQVLVGNVFKGRATRFDEDDIGSMRLLRDRAAPDTLPENVWFECIQNDEKLQEIEQETELLRENLNSDKLTVAETTELYQKLKALNKKYTNRMVLLKRHRLKKLRDTWFEERVENILDGSTSDDISEIPQALRFSSTRKDVIHALYPDDSTSISLLSAADALVTFVESPFGHTIRSRSEVTTKRFAPDNETLSYYGEIKRQRREPPDPEIVSLRPLKLV